MRAERFTPHPLSASHTLLVCRHFPSPTMDIRFVSLQSNPSSVPSPRRVYYIPELLGMIISYLIRPATDNRNPDLVRLALTTTYASRYALDALWKDLRALYPLTFIFKNTIHLPTLTHFPPSHGCCLSHIGHLANNCPEDNIGWLSHQVCPALLFSLSISLPSACRPMFLGYPLILEIGIV